MTPPPGDRRFSFAQLSVGRRVLLGRSTSRITGDEVSSEVSALRQDVRRLEAEVRRLRREVVRPQSPPAPAKRVVQALGRFSDRGTNGLGDAAGNQRGSASPMESSDQNMKLYTCMDALLDEMEDFVRETYGCDSAGWRSGDFAAGALLEYKGRHGDARMGHWTVGDVRTFLLGWFPRTIMADEDVRSDVPDCIAVFFRFMAGRGSLTGAPLHELEAACTDLRGQFLSNCSDPRLWDAAKVRLSLIVAPPAADVHDAHPPLHASAGARRRRTRGAARAAARTDPSGPVPRSTTPRFS